MTCIERIACTATILAGLIFLLGVPALMVWGALPALGL